MALIFTKPTLDLVDKISLTYDYGLSIKMMPDLMKF